MMEERYRILNQELDGANTPDQSEALRSYLASNEEARREFEELGRMAALFVEAGDVEPPPSLEQRIMDAVAARETIGGERGFFFDFLGPRRKIAYAFAAGLAAGLVVFIVIYQVFIGDNQLDVRDLYGALAERERAGAVIDAQSATIAVSGVTGTAVVQYREEAIIVSATLGAESGAEIEIAPAAHLSLLSFRARDCPGCAVRGSGAGVAVEIGDRGGFVAVFRDERREHPPVRILVTSAGAAVFDRTIAMRGN